MARRIRGWRVTAATQVVREEATVVATVAATAAAMAVVMPASMAAETEVAMDA